jgi:hypothetical protein
VRTSRKKPSLAGARLGIAILLLLAGVAGAYASPEISLSEDESTIIVGNAPEQEVYALGKSVHIQKQAKGVLAIGGDIVIEGRVEGDVATIGGDIIQEENGYVGGDVIVFGGEYRPKSQTPLREPNKETVMFAAFEDDIRSIAQNPSHIISPSLTWSFVAQRAVVALLWFVISIVLTTVAPGAFSRAVVRINLSPLKVCAMGAGAFLCLAVLIVVSAFALPTFLSATVGAMFFLLIILGYVFGRVALQLSLGKMIQKHLFSEKNRSETLATLVGVLAWTILLSLPYLWVLAVFAIFAFGVGLVVTAPSRNKREFA